VGAVVTQNDNRTTYGEQTKAKTEQWQQEKQKELGEQEQQEKQERQGEKMPYHRGCIMYQNDEFCASKLESTTGTMT
jgi:hypothetical protein